MSPTQRAAWLKRNPLPKGYGLIHVSELDAMHDQLVLHREALEKIGALLGPYLVAAKGDPVAAVQRVLKRKDEFEKECIRLQELSTHCDPDERAAVAAYNDLLDEIRELRTMLAIAHAGVSLYHDDSELQDYATEPGIDWKRDSLDELRRKLFERSMKALNKVSPGSPDAALR